MRNLTGSGGTCWALCNGPHHPSDWGELFYLSQCHSARRCPAAFNAICFKHLATFWPCNLQARTKCPWTDLTQNSTSNLILLKISNNSVCCKKCKDTWQCSYQIWLQDNTGVLFGNLLRVLVHKEHWPSFFHSSLTSGNLILRQVSYPGITLFFISFHFSSFNIQIKLTWNMIDLKCIAHANFFSVFLSNLFTWGWTIV